MKTIVCVAAAAQSVEALAGEIGNDVRAALEPTWIELKPLAADKSATQTSVGMAVTVMVKLLVAPATARVPFKAWLIVVPDTDIVVGTFFALIKTLFNEAVP